MHASYKDISFIGKQSGSEDFIGSHLIRISSAFKIPKKETGSAGLGLKREGSLKHTTPEQKIINNLI